MSCPCVEERPPSLWWKHFINSNRVGRGGVRRIVAC